MGQPVEAGVCWPVMEEDEEATGCRPGMGPPVDDIWAEVVCCWWVKGPGPEDEARPVWEWAGRAAGVKLGEEDGEGVKSGLRAFLAGGGPGADIV